MRRAGWIAMVTVLVIGTGLSATQASGSHCCASVQGTAVQGSESRCVETQGVETQRGDSQGWPERGQSESRILQARMNATGSGGELQGADEEQLLEKSREAGLLTDWHILGHFGHKGPAEFRHVYAPEKEATKHSARHPERQRYELVFPEGTFTLPKETVAMQGVFYAVSSTYLTSSGDWNVYLESGADAVVFVDGLRTLASAQQSTGVLREKIHLESGYHSVLVKFTAQAAPFRVAILPQNSGSRRKNNTPYLQASPASEDMMAGTIGSSASGL